MDSRKESMGAIMALMKDIACIQLAINRVREISRKVNLAAINAGLAVRGLGSAGLGYSVAAQELRVFSVKLNAHTGVLGGNIGEVVKRAAVLVVETRKDMLLRQALMLSKRQRMKEVVEAQSALIEQGHMQLDRSVGRLESALHTMHALSYQGLSLTRASRVEAAHAGEHRRRLTTVAQEMEDSVVEMMDLNKAAQRRLEAWR
jgi:methyl-accepting chemotaxis protein